MSPASWLPETAAGLVAAAVAALPPFLVGALAGGVATWLLRPAGARRSSRLPPAVSWRSMTQHEVSFLRRVWRTGFILEEDDALRQDRPEVLHATLHDLMQTRGLVHLDRVRGPSVSLRAYRLTAAGKDLMTWVTNVGR